MVGCLVTYATRYFSFLLTGWFRQLTNSIQNYICEWKVATCCVKCTLFFSVMRLGGENISLRIFVFVVCFSTSNFTSEAWEKSVQARERVNTIKGASFRKWNECSDFLPSLICAMPQLFTWKNSSIPAFHPPLAWPPMKLSNPLLHSILYVLNGLAVNWFVFV